MSSADTKTISQVNAFSIAGPLFVIASLLLLVIRESTFLIDLSAVAGVGLVLSSRLKTVGFAGATLLLASVIGYEHFFTENSLTAWDFGLSFSLELAFLVSTLASLEFFETFQSIGQRAFQHVTQWEAKISEANAEKGKLEIAVADLQARLLASADQVKGNIEKSERFEKLAQLAKEELIQQIRLKESFESASIASQLQIEQLKDQLENLEIRLESHKTALQSLGELKESLKLLKEEKEAVEACSKSQSEALSFELIMKSELLTDAESKIQTLSDQLKNLPLELQKKNDLLIDAEGKIQTLNDQFQAFSLELKKKGDLLIDAEGKIQTLSDQLDKLTDQLKGLQSEKDELEKALDEALKPVPAEDLRVKESREVRRVEGLYQQLRMQFAEKSQMLADTRRTLFHTEEQLLALQKDYAEATLFGERELKPLTQQIQALEKEISDKQQEITRFEEIITSLCQELASHDK